MQRGPNRTRLSFYFSRLARRFCQSLHHLPPFLVDGDKHIFEATWHPAPHRLVPCLCELSQGEVFKEGYLDRILYILVRFTEHTIDEPEVLLGRPQSAAVDRFLDGSPEGPHFGMEQPSLV